MTKQSNSILNKDNSTITNFDIVTKHDSLKNEKSIKPIHPLIITLSSHLIDPYKDIEELKTHVNSSTYTEKDKQRAVKIIKCLELLVEDPCDNFNIKNFVQEYQKVHNIDNGTGHEKGFIKSEEKYTTDYYAMPYDGVQDGNVQHSPDHENAYVKRTELIKAIDKLKNIGKKLKADVLKSKLGYKHKKELFNLIDNNNTLILEFDSTKNIEEFANLEELSKLNSTAPINYNPSNKTFIKIIDDLEKGENNPFHKKDEDNMNTSDRYDSQVGSINSIYNEYRNSKPGAKNVAMNPQDKSDFMYSVTYKNANENKNYTDIFGIESIFRILRLTGSNITPDSANENKSQPYNIFNNYYKTDKRTKNPVYVSKYTKESTWNTNLLDEKQKQT